MTILRIELHRSQDYLALHREMESRAFTRTIPATDGSAYHLPTGEYFYAGQPRTLNQILGLAQTAVGVLGLNASILCTEGSVMFANLPKAA